MSKRGVLLDKKGALELSITAIVVLIIAITVLGFAIFFIKSLFGGGQEIFTKQFAQVKQQLTEEFAERGITVGFDVGNNLEVKRGDKLEFILGVSNTENDPLCYATQIKCEQAFAEGNDCEEKGDGVIVAGRNSELSWFPVFPKPIMIQPNDIETIPVVMQLTKAKKDTYRMNLMLFKADNCDNIDFAPEKTIETVPFYIKLT